MLTEKDAWQMMDLVMDPEIPAVSILGMGMVRSIEIEGSTARISLAPTFSGCPAQDLIKREVEARISQAGLIPEVSWTFAPPWSSDWISPEARQKMASIGLAPPPIHAGLIELALTEAVSCPHCGSQNTVQKNSFGPTL
ncbi:MAG TPA: 1,2-phenylacetyl-CoA epoxidase subunit PaaD, partial [Anaerolineales bacterium]